MRWCTLSRNSSQTEKGGSRRSDSGGHTFRELGTGHSSTPKWARCSSAATMLEPQSYAGQGIEELTPEKDMPCVFI